MYTYVVLRQPEIGELVFGVPAPGQRCIVLVHHGVQVFQPVLALLAERAAAAACRPDVARRTAADHTAAVRTHHRRIAAVRAGRHYSRGDDLRTTRNRSRWRTVGLRSNDNTDGTNT